MWNQNNQWYAVRMTSSQKKYAGFWKRVAAVLLDGLILGAAISFLTAILMPGTAVDGSSGNGMIGTVAAWLYFALFESSDHQATPGKILLSIRVTDEKGKRIDFGRATGRYFAKILSGLILCAGFLMAAFTKKKQGLHDLIAGTLVVNK